MTECQRRLESWRTDPYFDQTTRDEAAALTDDVEIEDRFCRELEFGTGGVRGVMAAGPNRINRYTVRRITQALADWLLATEGAAARRRGVVIACDSRLHSAEFARETALTLCANGIPAYRFEAITPTPVLSFAVRQLDCLAGVMITASHNPKEYNGYKAFDRSGCQLLPRQADAVLAQMQKISITSVRPMEQSEALAAGLLHTVGPSVLDAFLDAAASQSHTLEASAKDALHIVYSPLNGAGNLPVRRILSQQGYRNVTVVPEQEKPDGSFPTVAVPNPEDREALDLSIRLACAEGADLVLATDPDCDRVAVAAFHGGLFQTITGNQLGSLLVNYILTRRAERLSPASTLVKTIVTGDLGASIARAHNVQVVEVPTGFKYVGDQVRRCEADFARQFIMGYEESCGYLIGTHARDKDAVGASLLVCEMAAYYKAHGQTLIDVIGELYEQYGYYMNSLDTYTIPGTDWKDRVQRVMSALRRRSAALTDIDEVLDYSAGIAGLPKCDVLKFCFSDGSWMAVRPSGTEPKIKVYHATHQKDRAAAERAISAHRAAVLALVGQDAAQ